MEQVPSPPWPPSQPCSLRHIRPRDKGRRAPGLNPHTIASPLPQVNRPIPRGTVPPNNQRPLILPLHKSKQRPGLIMRYFPSLVANGTRAWVTFRSLSSIILAYYLAALARTPTPTHPSLWLCPFSSPSQPLLHLLRRNKLGPDPRVTL